MGNPQKFKVALEQPILTRSTMDHNEGLVKSHPLPFSEEREI